MLVDRLELDDPGFLTSLLLELPPLDTELDFADCGVLDSDFCDSLDFCCGVFDEVLPLDDSDLDGVFDGVLDGILDGVFDEDGVLGVAVFDPDSCLLAGLLVCLSGLDPGLLAGPSMRWKDMAPDGELPSSSPDMKRRSTDMNLWLWTETNFDGALSSSPSL